MLVEVLVFIIMILSQYYYSSYSIVLQRGVLMSHRVGTVYILVELF